MCVVLLYIVLVSTSTRKQRSKERISARSSADAFIFGEDGYVK